MNRYPKTVACPICGKDCEVVHCDPDTEPVFKPYAQCDDEECKGYEADIHVEPFDDETMPMF